MKRIILICGLIRKIEILKKSLIIYNQLIKDGVIHEIILCTDKEIIDNVQKGNVINKQIKEMLNYYNVNIIEHETLSLHEIKKLDPKIETRPHCQVRKKNIFISIWREAYNFKMGLENIPDDSFVLKTRCDLLLSYNLLKKIFTSYIVKLEENNIFEYKIWGGGFHYCEPLHLADYAVMGYKKDIFQMVSLNAQHLNWNNTKSGFNTSDTIWWIPIFYKKYPIIKSFFEEVVGNYKSHQLIENDIFYKCIANHIFIMNKYFILDSGINEYTLYPTWGGSKIYNSSSLFLQYPNTQNSQWILNFIKGNFNSNKIINSIFDEYQKLIK